MMLLAGFNLDQIETLLAVVETQSFSAAARSLGRAQSAVTYAIKKLEDQLGCELFDRSAYRPALTPAGKSLLPHIRALSEEASNLAAQAQAIERGIEPELTIVADAMFPKSCLIGVLAAWSRQFPTVTPRVYVESMGTSARLLLDGTAQIGLLLEYAARFDALDRRPLGMIELGLVVAAGHELAQIAGPVPLHELRRHVQLVLTDRSGLSGDRDDGVLSARTWRLGDLGAKHAMLRAGLGFGSMPLHMIAEDLASGALVRLVSTDDAARPGQTNLPLCSATRRAEPPGPAGQWLLTELHRARAGAKQA